MIVLAEDLTRYALEVAEVYAINKRFAGFIDYKRVRWFPTPYGLLPQVLLVDAKASTENNRDTLQQSQLPMDAEFVSSVAKGTVVRLTAGVPSHLEIPAVDDSLLLAVTTSVFIHFYYQETPGDPATSRELRDIFVLGIPHSRLKPKYNPTPDVTFFGQGKHSPARGEEPRIRVYFHRLRSACPWRLQHLTYSGSTDGFTLPMWRDVDDSGTETNEAFLYLQR